MNGNEATAALIWGHGHTLLSHLYQFKGTWMGIEVGCIIMADQDDGIDVCTYQLYELQTVQKQASTTVKTVS